MSDDGWVELFEIERVGTGPIAVQVSGREVVLWRTSGGRLAALDDECPHQGTQLSGGSVVGESLRCPKHGWEVGTDGWCDQASAGTVAHRVRELDGSIWVRLR